MTCDSQPFCDDRSQELSEANAALERWYEAASPYATPEALKEALKNAAPQEPQGSVGSGTSEAGGENRPHPAGAAPSVVPPEATTTRLGFVGAETLGSTTRTFTLPPEPTELTAMMRDAERYRWIVANYDHLGRTEVDAAMAHDASQSPPQKDSE